MEEDFKCEYCDSEFTIKHYSEEGDVVFCPFCGDTLSKEDNPDWEDPDDSDDTDD